MSSLNNEGMRGQGIDPTAFEREAFTQFQTWLGETKSVEGCPVNCTYCFFKLDGQTPLKPNIGMSPQETVDQIGQAPTYHEDMPINLGSQTDAFSTRKNVEHYSEVVQRYGDSDYPNPLVFITKRRIPESFMQIAKDIGQPVVFYMSYSGLGGTGLEPTVKDEHLRDNFIGLKAYDLPRVHYWRPFMPQNSKPEKIADMLSFVSENANCSTLNGLKLNDGIRDNIAPFWPEIMDKEYDYSQSGDFWPEGVRDYVRHYAASEHPDYPLFFDTACSLAYVLKRPDIQGVYQGALCRDSQCPPSQQALCAGQQPMVHTDMARKVAKEVDIDPSKVELEDGKVIIDSEVATGSLVYVRSSLRLPVISKDVNYAGHNWASSVDAENAIIEVPWSSK